MATHGSGTSWSVFPPAGSVLLVEDNPADVFIVRQVFALARVPLQLEVAADAEQALWLLREKSRRDTLSAVLLDLNLPGLPGISILELVRKEGWNVPVVVVTCSEWPGDLAKIAELRPDAYFRKPFTLEEYLELPKTLSSVLTFTSGDDGSRWA